MSPARMSPAYFIAVATLVNKPLTLEPSDVTAAAMATATPEAIIAYSIAVAPDSSCMKRRTGAMIVDLGNLSMVFLPSGRRITTAS